MNQRRADEQSAAQGWSRQNERCQPGEQGKKHKGENHFDCGLRIADCGFDDSSSGSAESQPIASRQS
jgi:hypothetical protein